MSGLDTQGAGAVLASIMRDAGGGWVRSTTIREIGAERGLTEWQLRAARIALGVRISRRRNGRDHESLWLHPDDAERSTRLPDGSTVTTPIGPEETAADLDARHDARVKRETRGHMLVGAAGVR